ncbi:MAG: hypothetical protein QW757_03725 [Candidatus Woesearchaeota archaeon]
MKNKTQITIFFIIGLIVIISAVIFLSFNRKPYFQKTEVSFKNNILTELKSCVETKVYESIKENGLNYNKNSLYLNTKIRNCGNDLFSYYINKGYNVINSEPKINIEISEDSFFVNVDYYIQITKDNENYKIDSFFINVPLTNSYKINNNYEGIIFSADKQARLFIKKNSGINDILSVKVVDKNFDNLKNDIVVSNVYEFLPDGLSFNQPLDLELDLPNNDFFDLSQATIAYWDEKSKIWKGLKSELKDNKLITKVNHFTKFAIVLGCNEKSNNNIIDVPALFQQKYGYNLVKKDNEKEEDFVKRYNDFILGFCRNEVIENKKEPFWLINDDETISPTREEFLKILKNDDAKIELNKQFLDKEKYLFDGTDFCEEEALVNVYCCCTDNNNDGIPESCLDKPLSQQECWAKEYYIFNYKEQSICPQDSSLYEKVRKKIIGYNNKKCIGGKVEDGNNDGFILQLNFMDNGNACIFEDKEVEIVSIYNGLENSSKCNLNYNLMKDNNFGVIINSINVKEPDEGFCANCGVRIKFNGIGIENYTINNVCNDNETAKFVYEEGLFSCRKCKLSNGVYMTSDEMVNEEECLCNYEMLGSAFCKIKKKCDLVNGKPQLVDWTDEKETSLCEICTPLNKDVKEGCEKVIFMGG